jgi:hypothetical protein
MREVKRGKRGGKRGNTFARSVKAEVGQMLGSDSTSRVLCEGKAGYTPAMNTHFLGEETQETHIIPRESITKRQGLGMFSPAVEFEQMSDTVRYQRDKRTGELVRTTDPGRFRKVWQSDRTLLSRTKVDQLEDIVFKRTGSVSKLTRTEVERPATVEIPVKPELDDIDL